MSVLFDTANDQVYSENGTTLTIGTGDFAMLGWVRITTDLNTNDGAMFGIADAITTAYTTKAVVALPAGASGVGFEVRSATTATAEYNDTVDLWRGVVLSRASGVIRCRVFDDSTSTTPLSNLTSAETTDWTTLDSIGVGKFSQQLSSTRMKVANLKFCGGAGLSDVEARTELRYFGWQQSLGSYRYCWKFKGITADTDGINELLGVGPNLTNSGATTDADMPTNLSEFGTLLGKPTRIDQLGNIQTRIGPSERNVFNFNV